MPLKSIKEIMPPELIEVMIFILKEVVK